MPPGYGLSRRVRTRSDPAVGEQGSPQAEAPTGRRDPPHDRLSRMQMVTDRIRWCATDDERSLLAWAADRASAAGRHLAPVAAVGRLPDGRLVVEVTRPTGTPLAAALDTLGTPTTGVAVTLTVPLLELAAAERSGAVRLGTAGLDDVLVDDAGAVLLCDRPTGAETSTASGGAGGAASPGGATTPSGHRRSDQDGARVLLLAARVVWERTDERDPARAAIGAALAEALDGGVDAVRAALATVRAAAAPRPVRWEPLPFDPLGCVPTATATNAETPLLRTVQDVLERGVPLRGGRRLPLRRALVGVVVASGLTAAAVFSLG